MSNEELLLADECPHSRCIEPVGHNGVHSFEMAPKSRLEAENARLQERVEKLEKTLCSSDVHCLCRYSAATAVERAEQERDRYEALAERFATSLHYKDVHELPFKDCPYRICQEARAAIDAAPDEAREKERKR